MAYPNNTGSTLLNIGGGSSGGKMRVAKSPNPPSSAGSDALHARVPSDMPQEPDAGDITSSFSSPDGMGMILNHRFFMPRQVRRTNYSNTSVQGYQAAESERSSSLAPREPMRAVRPRTGNSSLYGVPGGFRSSRTWVSPDTQYQQEFTIVRNSMRRLFKHSEVAKWKLPDYIAHREAMVASQKAALAKSVAQKELERELREVQEDPQLLGSLSQLLPGYQNLGMEGNLSRVLGMKTIWCVNWIDGKDEIAPWPTFAEMKWEGDDRAKTNCGRFLALPREPGAPGLQWGQLQVLEQYPLDQVHCVPTMEDIYLPVDEIEEVVIPKLINKGLLDAINEYLES